MELIDQQAIRRENVRRELVGVNTRDRRLKGAALRRAEIKSVQQVRSKESENRALHKQYLAALELWWRKLNDNENDVVTLALTSAFEDNDATAAVVGVADAEASIIVLVPDASAVPERVPGRTELGNVSLRKMLVKERDAFYMQMVCGYLLATVKETFAVAPGLKHCRLVAVRSNGVSAYGHNQVDALIAVRFAREHLVNVRWDLADAATILHECQSELVINYRGSGPKIEPIVLSNEPEIAALIGLVDLDDL
jgi:hypothetical protein